MTPPDEPPHEPVDAARARRRADVATAWAHVIGRTAYVPMTAAEMQEFLLKQVTVLADAVNAERSRLELSFGTSPLGVIRGYRQHLKVYPYYCSEQVSSVALPLIALYRAQRVTGGPPLASAPKPATAPRKNNPAINIDRCILLLFWRLPGDSNPRFEDPFRPQARRKLHDREIFHKRFF